MRTTFSKLISVAALSAFVSTGFAQANLGADCGCPAVASRPVVTLSSKGTAFTGDGAKTSYVLKKNLTLYCDTVYRLDSKFYVDSAVTLTIKPGTVIKADSVTDPTLATALIVQRYGKIYAAGTETSPIVFTSVGDDLNGSMGYSKRGKWGGVAILGNATNNLTMAKNNGTGKYCVGKDGQGFIEGFDASNGRNLYGGSDDNDNSGVLRYVSIRHSGAILNPGNELNGLSLGSVGRGTTIDHIELICSDDDGIEFFGGTVNVSYVAAMFGNDDMFDYDLGFRGKLQFLFGLDAPDAVANMNDNGFEGDNDDNSSFNTPYSTPVICNATIIGNNTSVWVNDQSGSAAFMAKENTRGEVYNSVFANYLYGLCLGNKSANGTNDGYYQWQNGTFMFKNNTLVNINASIIKTLGTNKSAAQFAADKAAVTATDSTNFFSAGNGIVKAASISGFDYTYAMNAAGNAAGTDLLDVVPNPALGNTVSCPIAAPYRGAFDSSKKPWISTWSYAAVLGASTGLVACPTDANGDGTTTTVDLVQLLGKLGSSCQ